MNKALGDVFDKTVSLATGLAASNADALDQTSNNHTSLGNHNRRDKRRSLIVDIATPTLSESSSAQHTRAILVEASTTTFGNDCLRLVNIVFQTSQTFPSIMGTCNSISQYLRKELSKKYPGEYFHVIIGQNNGFAFAIDDGDYFAEIEQEQYRILIFTVRLDRRSRFETHDANSQMILEWKAVGGKQSKK